MPVLSWRAELGCEWHSRAIGVRDRGDRGLLIQLAARAHALPALCACFLPPDDEDEPTEASGGGGGGFGARIATAGVCHVR